MSTRKLLVLVSVLVSTIVTVGCKPASTHSRSRQIGRSAFPGSTNGIYSQTNSGNAGTTWGQLTSNQGDQTFDDQLYYMTLPMLNGAGADQQMGYVSSAANQATYVSFWGQVPMNGTGSGTSATGQVDSSKARIHIEIWDDKAVSSGVSPIVLHIGYDFEGYQGATGSVQGSQATVTFNDSSYGSIALQGTVSGQYYSGTMYFKNAQTGGQFYPAGNFQVPACGFFVCQ